jgi:NAD(P)-dependent dehydrogenase (short-subunit alcohol dehydrogenase family)
MASLAQAQTIDLSGQVAIVTGGTRGLGRDIAAALAGAGARVVAFARNAPEQPIEGVSFLLGDIRDAEVAKALVDQVLAEHGRLDILVNNAGGSPAVAAESVSPRFVEAILKLNLVAPLHLAQAAHPHMVRTGGGSIVNIASVSGIRPSPALPFTAQPRRACST